MIIPIPEKSVDWDDEVKRFAQAWLIKALETCHTKHEGEKFLDDCLIVLNKLRTDVVPDMLYETCPYDRIIKFPVGFLQMYMGVTPPKGWFLCDGQEFDPVKYPKLSALLIEAGLDGTHVPDMRECVPVGAGQNTTHPIAAHDEYTLGQFKDDQLQRMTGTMKGFQTEYDTRPAQCTGVFTAPEYIGATDSTRGHDACAELQFDSARVARSGAVTRTKQFGINYIIKHD